MANGAPQQSPEPLAVLVRSEVRRVGGRGAGVTRSDGGGRNNPGSFAPSRTALLYISHRSAETIPLQLHVKAPRTAAPLLLTIQCWRPEVRDPQSGALVIQFDGDGFHLRVFTQSVFTPAVTKRTV